MVAELLNTGQRAGSFVYAEGEEVLAMQTDRVVWEHHEPAGQSVRLAEASGTVIDEREETSSGAKIEKEDPYPADPNFTGADTDGSYPHLGTVGKPIIGCTTDGILIPDCSWIFVRISSFEIVEQTAAAWREFVGYSVRMPEGRPISVGTDLGFAIAMAYEYGSDTLIRNWLVNDTAFQSSAFSSLQSQAQKPQNPTQPSAKGFPCPPSVAEIFTGRDQSAVGKVLTAAGELFPKTGREEGGWIYMNRKGRLTARLNDRGGQNVSGLGMAIDLNNPPIVRGSIVVATFHTHDFGMDPSMPTGEKLSLPNDLWTNEEQGVPGIIVGAGDVRGFNGYGPKRGYWRQPLPKRCDK